MDILIVYDSYFGNTKKVATEIKKELEKTHNTDLMYVKELDINKLSEINYLVIGSPTRGFKATSSTMKFLRKLNKLKNSNLKVLVFDTRVNIKKLDNKFLKILSNFFGYATDSIAKKLRKNGFDTLNYEKGVFVLDSEGPIKEGEIEKINEWIKDVL